MPVGMTPLDRAADNGRLDVVQRLLSETKFSSYDIAWALNVAAAAGNLNVVKFLGGLDCVHLWGDHHARTLDAAVWSGSLELVKYLCELPGVEIDYNNHEAYCTAARMDSIELLQYLGGKMQETGLDLADAASRAMRTNCLSLQVAKFLCNA